MSALGDYEKRMNLEPLTEDEVMAGIDDAENFLIGGAARHARAVDADERLILWLADRVEFLSEAATKLPSSARCQWCLNAVGRTDEAWRALPLMSLDDVQVHVATCEHNPLVARIRDLEQDIRDLQE